MDTVTETLTSRLDALEVGVTRTTPDEFEAALSAVVTAPVVGAPFPFDTVSLPDSIPTGPTPAELRAARTGVTGASMGVAAYGSVVLPSTPEGSEPVSLFPERHVVVLRARDIVAGMPEAFARLGPAVREGRGSNVIATGPSATADMGALVKGAHGPKEVHVVVVEEEEEEDDG